MAAETKKPVEVKGNKFAEKITRRNFKLYLIEK